MNLFESIRVALHARLIDERGKEVTTVALDRSQNEYRAVIEPLQPGAYRVIVGGIGATVARIAPVTSTVLVWDPEAT